jgi:hypothetical protein
VFVGVFAEGPVKEEVLREKVEDERESNGLLLARLALFCNLLGRLFGGGTFSFSRIAAFSASNSDCQISSLRRGTVCAGGASAIVGICGDEGKAGDNRLCCEVGESGVGSTYECLRSPVCSGDLERSSWWTAREKRRQKLGSWTIVTIVCAGYDLFCVSYGRVGVSLWGREDVYVLRDITRWWAGRDSETVVSLRFVLPGSRVCAT